MSFPIISPKYMLNLIEQVKTAIWESVPKRSYRNVYNYIRRWQTQEFDSYGNICDENFQIYMTDDHIDLEETLYNMPDEYIIRIATDLGVETPGFLPVAIEEFKNVLHDNNQTALQNFERAIKNAYENPDESVLLASSTLDGIIKTILNHESIALKTKIKNNKGLKKQAAELIRLFKEESRGDCPQEIFALSSALNSACGAIDDLRSNKTPAHGSRNGEYVVDDPLWALFIINSMATIGLFLWQYFDKKYNLSEDTTEQSNNDLIEFDINDIPF